MVLLELGRKITNALKKMDNSTTVNEKIIKGVLNEIGLALLQADVSLQYVKNLKDKVQLQFKLNESQGSNLRKIVQRAVVDELTNMLETDKKPYQPKKGKSNVVMFVGLQGSFRLKLINLRKRKNHNMCKICILLDKKKFQNSFSMRRYFQSRSLRPAEAECHKTENSLLRIVFGNGSCENCEGRRRVIQKRRFRFDYCGHFRKTQTRRRLVRRNEGSGQVSREVN